MATSHLESTLPSQLNTPEFLPKIKKGVMQWSRITAWSWTDYLAFAGEPQAEEEKKLKTLLIQVLKQQAQCAGAYTSYGDPKSKVMADNLSEAINNLLLGRNDLVPQAVEQGISLTLSQLMEKITGEKLVTTEYPYFTNLFYSLVVTDTFNGKLIDAPMPDVTTEMPFISVIAYPPRPVLSELTVTEDELVAWASNQVPGGDYLPPSAYIPIAVC
ncbi:MAG TPA: hypothetical protein DEG17_08745 [Cyanobacteria bacterium UBA11149]|nr:hypothetical protein [Cyanobacteria bacterium UBA11367]HBE56983.1 hypothetical protein [Cyanobacteria bacterium UBA11366]HBK63504.1 hypothetical protein [Cyanobacteria bacterium UBA11166]HBR75974.1 hypothetical protein [Cyanobacteria bacterium UBA11159]HBS71391.1 hypothetical protein [Cyanobacteria bacterium UBA11153]HBW88944.1 hypothetical protein [Cyanobacteria bacterium UBA11149]HCA95676.1 hypothetical protein [Cyanobacteria bacterium UBA9226]